jgi:hypothetical protein
MKNDEATALGPALPCDANTARDNNARDRQRPA